jgi:ferredoxin
MATMITSECINCGACEPECPNTAIYQGAVQWLGLDGATMSPALSDEIFYIVPEKCTECVGFHDHEACAAVCPVDCCVPNPAIPESHDVLLQRARALHPGDAIPDDAPSRFKKEGGAEGAGEGTAPAAAAPAPKPAPAAAPVAAAAAEPQDAGLAIPSLEEWEVPIRCFRCEGGYTVPYLSYRAGTVFRCPHCMASLVPTLSMVSAVRDAVEQFHTEWSTAFARLHEKRQRELEQFEERQRRELAEFEERLVTIAQRDHVPGAPVKRKGFFSF